MTEDDLMQMLIDEIQGVPVLAADDVTIERLCVGAGCSRGVAMRILRGKIQAGAVECVKKIDPSTNRIVNAYVKIQ